VPSRRDQIKLTDEELGELLEGERIVESDWRWCDEPAFKTAKGGSFSSAAQLRWRTELR
jgi:hypothetical protein